MSTLSTTNLKNPASSSNNIVLGADGSVSLELSSLNGGPLAGFRNRIINGDMRIAQRGTSFAAIANTTYSLDRWQWNQNGAMVCTVSQDTSVPNNTFQSSYKVDVTTADTSIAAGDFALVVHNIEGYNVRDLIGTTFTLSFWVKSPKTGTHCVAFRNGGFDRAFVKEYTVLTANTWEYKTLTVTGGLNAAGTWNWINGPGLNLAFTLATGTTFQTTADAWQTGNFISTANQVNVMDNTANDFFLTGVQLEPGSVATPFERRPIGTELALCQRYYSTRSDPGSSKRMYNNTGGFSPMNVSVDFPVVMRTVPNVSVTVDISDGAPIPGGGAGTTASAYGFSAYTNISNGQFLDYKSHTASAEL